MDDHPIGDDKCMGHSSCIRFLSVSAHSGNAIIQRGHLALRGVLNCSV